MLSYNKLVRLRNEADQAFSSIEVQLKRRADLVPNLVESVKALRHARVGGVRAGLEGPGGDARRHGPRRARAADVMMQGAIGGLFGIAEAYPELRAVEGFNQLQAELSDTEDKIAAARRYYDAVSSATTRGCRRCPRA